MGQKVLKIDNLTHGYPSRPLFKEVHLELEKGDRVAIIGPNGAGVWMDETLSLAARVPGSRTSPLIR